MQAAGFEPATFRGISITLINGPEVGRKTNKAKRSTAELCLHASKWKGSHLRPRGPGPRALLLSYTTKTLRRGEWIRTIDLSVPNGARYQLRHTPKSCRVKGLEMTRAAVTPHGGPITRESEQAK